MAERFERHRQPWTGEELDKLKTLARKGMALKAIAKALTRSEESIKDRAKLDGIGIAKLRYGALRRSGIFCLRGPAAINERTLVKGAPGTEVAIGESGTGPRRRRFSIPIPAAVSSTCSPKTVWVGARSPERASASRGCAIQALKDEQAR